MLHEDLPITHIPPYAHRNLIRAVDILDKLNIAYWYQPRLKIATHNKIVTIVPDLYLPELHSGIYRFDTSDYFRPDKRFAKLEKVCSSAHIGFIPLPPEYQNKAGSTFPTLKHEKYEKYLFDLITKLLTDQLVSFKSKIRRY